MSDIKFEITKMYTSISQEEYNTGIEELNTAKIKSRETVTVSGREFPPFLYEIIDFQPYRFDGYDVSITIDGYRSDKFSGFFQPNQVACYHRIYDKTSRGAQTALNLYESVSEEDEDYETKRAKYWDKYQRCSQTADFYGSILRAFKESE
jgi:hypothetical protein